MDSNGLGIKDLISDTISEFEVKKNGMVEKLITDFKIKELIVTTLKNSKLSFDIDLSSIDYLPKEYFVGRITWSSVYDEMKRVLDEEGVSLTIHTKKTGGCCSNPEKWTFWKCRDCKSLRKYEDELCEGCGDTYAYNRYLADEITGFCKSCESGYQQFEKIEFDKLSARISIK